MAEVYDRLGRLDRRELLARRAAQPSMPRIGEEPAAVDDDGFAEVLEAVGRVVLRWPGVSVMVAQDGRPGQPVFRVSELDGTVDAAIVGHQATQPAEPPEPPPARPRTAPVGTGRMADALGGASRADRPALDRPAPEPADETTLTLPLVPTRTPTPFPPVGPAPAGTPVPFGDRAPVGAEAASGPDRPAAEAGRGGEAAEGEVPARFGRMAQALGGASRAERLSEPEKGTRRPELRLVPGAPSGRHAHPDEPDEPAPAEEAGGPGPAGRVPLPTETSEAVARLAQILRANPSLAATWGRESQEG